MEAPLQTQANGESHDAILAPVLTVGPSFRIWAVALAGVEAEIVHVTDPREIVAHGILSTPGLVIDGRIVSYGRVPSAGDIAAWLSAPATA